MAFGPMSVGSDGSLMLVTDPTLRQENMSADAKAVGDALDKKLDKTGGTVSGDIAFPAIGDVAKSKKISFSGSTDGAEIYYQTTASDQGNLVVNLLNDANCFLRIALMPAATAITATTTPAITTFFFIAVSSYFPLFISLSVNSCRGDDFQTGLCERYNFHQQSHACILI